MKTAAVICEYNPFHNGHAYQLAETRRLSGCDALICVMSGPFTQRGEPAVMDKWVRAELALRAGADAVFELPCAYALSSAEFFASGGVSLSKQLGAYFLSFGAESELTALQAAAEMKQSPAYSRALQDGLAQGMSYAAAASRPLEPFCGENGRLSPNDLLAVSYLCEIRKQKAGLTPIAVKRAFNAHDQALSDGSFASAKAIRALLREEGFSEKAAGRIPASCHDAVRAWQREEPFVFPESFDRAVLSALRLKDPDAFSGEPSGLGNLVYKAVRRYATISDVVAACTSAHFTATRISRFLWQTLFEIRRDLLSEESVPYARLLGFRRDRAGVLAFLESQSRIPIVKSVRAYLDMLPEDAKRARSLIRIDLQAQDLYSLHLRSPKRQCGARDFTEPLVIV